MTGNLTCENTISEFLPLLRLIRVIVMLHVVFKRHVLHKYLLFYYHCSFTSPDPQNPIRRKDLGDISYTIGVIAYCLKFVSNFISMATGVIRG